MAKPVRYATLIAMMFFAFVPHAMAANTVSPPCAPIMARLLPGEFHYCAAVRAWEAGRDHAGFEEARYAAEWGEKRAQFDLGVYYFNGRHGVAPDHALGLAWLTLAAERKDPRYTAILTSAQAQATPDEQTQARALLPKMIETYGDVHAVGRAESHYRSELWTIRDHVWRAVLASPVDPWSKDVYVDVEGLGTVHPAEALTTLQDIGVTYFKGWGGQVIVGPLIPVANTHSTAQNATNPSSH